MISTTKIMNDLGCTLNMASRVQALIREDISPCVHYGTVWTEEAPETPGWWWCLGPNRIIHVMRQRAFGDRLCGHFVNEWVPVEEMKNMLWAGPIPEPREP